MWEIKQAASWFECDIEKEITEKDPKKHKMLKEKRLEEVDDCVIIII